MNVSLLHFAQGQALRQGIDVFSFVTPLTPLILKGGILKGLLFLEW
jgi:hypothetical protein